jgi:formate dehydrogenase assembly factor FdhD|eukprot:TRINITY_DN86_c0_g1_i1.p2 TRINITY_DN86_c0_g1~~TRINITY_DN86_c0_g1_i1.p2  ORF type:complete len:106 (+),score=41.00 TRINITY_DN86_c0_g1_i1:98-415(+)
MSSAPDGKPVGGVPGGSRDKAETAPFVDQLHTRVASEKWLRATPELRIMVQQFMAEVLAQRPENVIEFAVGYFADAEGVRARIKEFNPEAQARLGDVFKTNLASE